MAQARRDEPLVPAFAVKLHGSPLITDIALRIVNVVVEDDLDMPSMFSLELISKEDERGPTPWTDDQRLALGTTVEISMGYDNDLESLIVGEITALEPTFTASGPPSLLVRGYDKRHRLNTVRRTQGYVDQMDSAIAKMICDAAHVAIDPTPSGVTHRYVLQTDQTDLAFLRERAHRMEYELAMKGETLLFRPVASAPRQAVTLTLNNDLIDFRPRMSLGSLSALTVQGWDPKTKQPFTSTAKIGDELTTMGGKRSSAQQVSTVLGDTTTTEMFVRTPVMSQPEADQMAKAMFNAAALDFIRGDGRARGRTDVRAGSVVQLKELGTRFSGEYYVTSAVHRYSPGEYLTDFQVRRNAS